MMRLSQQRINSLRSVWPILRSRPITHVVTTAADDAGAVVARPNHPRFVAVVADVVRTSSSCFSLSSSSAVRCFHHTTTRTARTPLGMNHSWIGTFQHGNISSPTSSTTTIPRRGFSSSDENTTTPGNGDIAGSGAGAGTPLAPFPFHHCEIVSLGGADVGRVEEILTPKGSIVEAGEPISFLTITTSNEEDGNEQRVSRLEFPAPISGIVQDILVMQGEEVRVGQDFCLIQRTTSSSDDIKNSNSNSTMNKNDAESSFHHTVAKQLIQHIRDNGGSLTNEYLQENILKLEDTTTLLHLVHLIRDQIPHLRPKALTLMERVLALQQQQGGEPAGSAQTYTEIAILHHQLGDMDMAALSARQALELRKLHLGSDHPETAASYIYLGMILQQGGNYPGAIDTIQSALEIQLQHSTEESPLALADTYSNLGALYYRTAKFPAAVEHYRKALEIYQQTHGERHKDTAGTYMNLAMALKFLQTSESKEQAVDHAKKSLQIRLELLGTNHADTAASHFNLGHLLSECEPPKYSKALEQYRAACTIQQELYGKTSSIVVASYNNMGAVRFNMQDYEGALEEYDHAMEILKETEADNPRFIDEMAATLNNRGMALLRRDKDGRAALKCHEQAKHLLEGANGGGADHRTQLAVTLRRMAHIHKEMLQFHDTLDLFRQAHVLLEDVYGKNHAETASSHNLIGVTLSAMTRYEEACAEYQLAKQSFVAALGKDHPEVAACHFNLGLTLVHQYQRDEKKRILEDEENNKTNQDATAGTVEALLQAASKEFQAAQVIWMKTHGMDHPRTKNAMINAQDPLLALRPGPMKR